MNRYPVNDCYGAVQGEGVNTGIPMVILRLHGCSVGCPWCDTKETWRFEAQHEVATLEAALGANARHVYLPACQIKAYCRTHFPQYTWILLTGGEPAQYDLRILAAALHEGGYRVALETSGTEPVDAGLDWVCVSPKINMPGGKRIRAEALAAADEIKMVIGRQADIDRLDALLLSHARILKPEVQICLQPISQNLKATALCLKTVQERGWRLSIQIHKLIGQR